MPAAFWANLVPLNVELSQALQLRQMHTAFWADLVSMTNVDR